MSKKKDKDAGGKGELSPADTKMVQGILQPRNEESLFATWLLKDKGKGATEDRLLVITADRILSITSKAKIAREAHLLELEEIESDSPSTISLSFKGWKIAGCTEQADELITTIRMSYHAAFGNVPADEQPKVNVTPESRLVELTKGEQICGGFAATYKSLCNFYGTPVREDICWDVNNLYPSNNITEFNLLEFEQPVSTAELSALIGALHHNTWFTSIVAREMVLDKKTIADIAAMFRKNKTITEVVLTGVGMNRDGLAALSDALAANRDNAVNTIDLSNNSFDEKGMQSFANFIGSMSHGVVRLNLASCGFNKAALQAFGAGLRKNTHSPSTLTILSLARNNLGAEGSSAVAQFLANPNALKELDLSFTDANLDVVLPAVIRGATGITALNISGNKLSAKAVKSMTTFLQSSDSLKMLNLASTSITVELLKDVLRAIGQNIYLQDLELNVADNKLGSGGASLIANLDTDARNIVALNVADNEFGDDGMSLVATGLARHQSLKVLDISRNFSPKPTKAREAAVDDLINLISGECPLETLVLRGNRTVALRNDLAPFLYGLATNDTLLRLDISGQQMGNKGALALGKALQINKKLQELRWDDNATTLQGFVNFRNGLLRNRSLKDMQVPVLDITAAIKSEDPKKLAAVFAEIQDMIARNCSPRSMLAKGAAGEMFGQLNILNSGERDHIERLRFKIKSTGRQLTGDQLLVLQDAENNDTTMGYFYMIAEECQVAMVDEITAKMREIANEVLPVVDLHYRTMVSRVIDTVREKYKSLDNDTVRRLNTSINFGAQELEAQTVQRILSSAAATEICTKANDSFMSALEIATGYIFEKLAEGMQDIVDDVHKAPQTDDDYRPTSTSSSSSSSLATAAHQDSADLSADDSADTSADETPVYIKSGPPKARAPDPPTIGSKPAAGAAAAATPARPDRPARPGSNVDAQPVTPPAGRGRGSPAAGASPAAAAGASPGRGRGNLVIPGGLDPSRMLVGGGPPPRKPAAEEPAPPPAAAAAAAPAPSASPAKAAAATPPSKSAKSSSGGGGLFGRKKAPAPEPKKPDAKKPAPPSAGSKPKPPAAGAAKPAAAAGGGAAAGDGNVLDSVPTEVNTITEHLTKDRPMIQRKRKPPTRRPRGPAAQGDS